MKNDPADHQSKSSVTPLPRPANAPQRKVFLRALELEAHIGVYAHEQGIAQPLRFDIELDVLEPADPLSDSEEDVVCYNKLTQGVKAIIAEGHIRLLETLAERIASLAMAHPMVQSATVRIEKPHAIAEAAAAGVEITRSKL